MNIKPILFNTEMVKEILAGRKVVTRRVIKLKYDNTHIELKNDKYGKRLIELQNDVEGETYGRNPDGITWQKLLAYRDLKAPYAKGDILYVRETWRLTDFDCIGKDWSASVQYKDMTIGERWHGLSPDEKISWRPSIHMPKKVARIWLKVTNVRNERLQDIDIDGCEKEGCQCGHNGDIFKFMSIWDSTIKKPELGKYGWGANPWVWVIEFERVKKQKF